MKEQTGSKQEPIDDPHAAFLRNAQDYLSVKEAAEIMGVSPRSVYGYIETGRLWSVRTGTSIRVSAASARAYQRISNGRPRSRVPIWRTPTTLNESYVWTITARLRQGQHEHLKQRLEEMRAGKKHLLPGTVARYIVHDEANPEELQMVFVWRQAVMPEEAEREAALAAFQAVFADIVDWETARSTGGRVVMHA